MPGFRTGLQGIGAGMGGAGLIAGLAAQQQQQYNDAFRARTFVTTGSASSYMPTVTWQRELTFCEELQKEVDEWLEDTR